LIESSTTVITPAAGTQPLQTEILAWYDANRRVLPWRALPGEQPDPYRVWLSEVMLQQTTVATVRGRYVRFLERWPTIHDLAAAPLNDVLHEWQGLGYYARARNLHKCAQAVAAEHAGTFPPSLEALRGLPGVGEYTAAAIASIAFALPAAPVDANVERVVARLAAIDEPLPAAKALIRQAAAACEPGERPGDWAQALMDLGTAICSPRAPKCRMCPAREHCQGHQAGIAETLPRKAPKKARPLRRGVVYWLEQADGAVLLRQRAPKGMLGGLWEFPSAGWDTKIAAASDLEIASLAKAWTTQNEPVRHGFTHFELELTVLQGVWTGVAGPDGSVWVKPAALGDYALPTLMKKVAATLV
jgi:A/G-specific adenine glycosylase